jgi:hypothetical protein
MYLYQYNEEDDYQHIHGQHIDLFLSLHLIDSLISTALLRITRLFLHLLLLPSEPLSGPR